MTDTLVSKTCTPCRGGIPPNYYRNNVIGGPGAFVMVAENSNSFGDVIGKKLIAEIAQVPAAGGKLTRPPSKQRPRASRGGA
jgi:Protein of unknown function (DUF1194)